MIEIKIIKQLLKKNNLKEYANELKLLNTGFSMGELSVTREEVHER